MAKIRRMLRDRKGATAIEYGLLCALIGVAMMASLTNVTNGIGKTFAKIGNNFTP